MTGRKKKILFSVLATLIILGLLEIIFRVGFYVRYRRYATTPSIQGSPLQAADRDLVYHNRPFYLDYNREYQFNELGFKSAAGDYRMPEKKPGDFWVFLFGGSAAEGMGSNKDGDWFDITGVPDHPYDSSLVAVLANELQKSLPGKTVRVFCAANSGFAIYQGYQQFLRLARDYQMDFVLSIDGNNEPLISDTGRSIRQQVIDNWEDYPIFKSPLKYIIPVTRSSVLANSAKQALFSTRSRARLASAEKNGFPKRDTWKNASVPAIRLDPGNMTAKRTVDSFFYYGRLFHDSLQAAGIRHLLFTQPHLSLRNHSRLTVTETALLNYYRSRPDNNAAFNTFIRSANELATSDSTIFHSLGFLHEADGEVFVDYCHFSTAATKLLASYLAARILEEAGLTTIEL